MTLSKIIFTLNEQEKVNGHCKNIKLHIFKRRITIFRMLSDSFLLFSSGLDCY